MKKHFEPPISLPDIEHLHWCWSSRSGLLFCASSVASIGHGHLLFRPCLEFQENTVLAAPRQSNSRLWCTFSNLPKAIMTMGSWSDFSNVSPSDMWLTSPSRKSCILTTATTIETRENAPKHITWNSKHKTWTLWLFQWGMLRAFPQCMIWPEFTEKVSQTMHCGILLNMPYWKNRM